MIEEGGGMSDELSKPAPDVFAAARTRRSVRAYKPDAVINTFQPPRIGLAEYATFPD